MQADLYGCGLVIYAHRERATGMREKKKSVFFPVLSSGRCCEKSSVNILLKEDKQNDGKGVKANALGC